MNKKRVVYEIDFSDAFYPTIKKVSLHKDDRLYISYQYTTFKEAKKQLLRDLRNKRQHWEYEIKKFRLMGESELDDDNTRYIENDDLSNTEGARF